MLWKPTTRTFAAMLVVLVLLTVSDIILEYRRWGHATTLHWVVLIVWLYYIVQWIVYLRAKKVPFV